MVAYKPVVGSQKNLLPGSRPAGPIQPDELASITVRVRSIGDISDLSKMAYDLAKVRLASRQYLTYTTLEQRFGARKEDLDAIERYAQSHHLFVSHRNALERSITLCGTLKNLLSAFPSDVQLYHHAGGTYRGRRGEIMVPAELQPLITSILGFDTRPRRRARSSVRSIAFAGPGGNDGVSPVDFATRYHFPSADGSGQTVAIVELGGGYQNSDLQIYFQELGIPTPNVSWVSVDKVQNAPGANDDIEVLLDIEVVGAVVPAANIVVYFAPNQGDKGFVDAISAAIHDTERAPSVLSISWGCPEDSLDQQTIDEFHSLFSAAAGLGITVCVSSGDHGTADLDAQHWDQKVHVDHPASDDLVLACGGTQIDPASGADVVWNDGTPFNINTPDGGGWASGGGISKIFGVPSYQANASIPVSIDTGQPGRGVPDIAMSATNYFVRVDSQEFADGGTSAVAPLMVGLVARINQIKQKRVGFLNPILYGNSGVTHDVTVGTNTITNTLQGYDAGPGWDACTGLGTPDGTEIANAIL
jgi:kumamolisin